MLTLYSYPPLFGVADNNGYGLKVYAFLKLAGVPFTHEHIFDASKAPRGQLPYIVDDGETVGDSETILAFLTDKYRIAMDAALTPAQRGQNLFVTRTLDDLYWVMSYSRWKDERYWPAFRDALMREHPASPTKACSRPRSSTRSAITTRASAAMSPTPRWRAGSPISPRWRGIIPAERLRAWRDADRHRRRHLRLHRQHLFLRYRHAAEAIRRRARQYRAALPGDPRAKSARERGQRERAQRLRISRAQTARGPLPDST